MDFSIEFKSNKNGTPKKFENDLLMQIQMQLAETLKEISSNLLRMREVELKSKMVSNSFLLSMKEAAEM